MKMCDCNQGRMPCNGQCKPGANDKTISESEMTECQFHNNCGGWCETRRELEHNLCEHCLDAHDEEMIRPVDLGTFVDWVHALKQERDELRHERDGLQSELKRVRVHLAKWDSLLRDMRQLPQKRCVAFFSDIDAALSASTVEVGDKCENCEKVTLGLSGGSKWCCYCGGKL